MSKSLFSVLKSSLVFSIIGGILLLPLLIILYVTLFYVGQWFSRLAIDPKQSIPLIVVQLGLLLYIYGTLTYGTLTLALINRISNDEWKIGMFLKKSFVLMVKGLIPFFLWFLITMNAFFHFVYRMSWEISGPPTDENFGQAFVFSILSFLVFSIFLLPLYLREIEKIIYYEPEDFELEEQEQY